MVATPFYTIKARTAVLLDRACENFIHMSALLENPHTRTFLNDQLAYLTPKSILGCIQVLEGEKDEIAPKFKNFSLMLETKYFESTTFNLTIHEYLLEEYFNDLKVYLRQLVFLNADGKVVPLTNAEAFKYSNVGTADANGETYTVSDDHLKSVSLDGLSSTMKIILK